MSTLIPWNLDGFVPAEEDMRQAASKHLHLGGLELPKVTSKMLLIPEHSWNHVGHIIGPSVAHLNIQDNSVLFISTASWIDEPVLPPFGSTISLGGRIYKPDDKAIEFLLEVVGGSKQDGDAISNSIGPFLSMPMVAEAATVRRRGIPLCTPFIIPKEWGDLKTIASVVSELVRGMGISLVISSEMIAVLPESEDPTAVPESIISAVPQFVKEVQKETKRDGTAAVLFQHLAKETDGEIHRLHDGKTIYESEVARSYSMWTKHPSFHGGVAASKLAPFIWRTISGAFKGESSLDLKLPEIPAVVELRMENSAILGGKARNAGMTFSLREAVVDILSTLENFGLGLADVPGKSKLRAILLDSFRVIPENKSGLEKRLAAGDIGVLMRSGSGGQRCIMPWEIRRYGDRSGWHVEETEAQLAGEEGPDISMWTFKAKDMPARLSWVLGADWEER